jgi:hypothetical protein
MPPSELFSRCLLQTQICRNSLDASSQKPRAEERHTEFQVRELRDELFLGGKLSRNLLVLSYLTGPVTKDKGKKLETLRPELWMHFLDPYSFLRTLQDSVESRLDAPRARNFYRNISYL